MFPLTCAALNDLVPVTRSWLLDQLTRPDGPVFRPQSKEVSEAFARLLAERLCPQSMQAHIVDRLRRDIRRRRKADSSPPQPPPPHDSGGPILLSSSHALLLPPACPSPLRLC